LFNGSYYKYFKLQILIFFLNVSGNFAEQPWLGGEGEGLASGEPGLSSYWYSYESLMVEGRTSGQNCPPPKHQ